MGARLMAIVAEGVRGRVYLSPIAEHEALAHDAKPECEPEQSLPDDPRNFWTVQYGLTTYGDLFTDHQLVALTTFSDLVGEARERVRRTRRRRPARRRQAAPRRRRRRDDLCGGGGSVLGLRCKPFSGLLVETLYLGQPAEE
jgi:hypothetical protein